LERLAMIAEEESYASCEDVSPAKNGTREKKTDVHFSANARLEGARPWEMTSRGAACLPSPSAASVAVAVDAVAAVPVFGVPVAVFVPAFVVAARVAARAAGAAAVVAAQPAAFWHRQHFSAEPAAARVSARAAEAVVVVSDQSVAGVVAGVAGQRFAERFSADPESAAARLVVFWHLQNFSAEAFAAPGTASARLVGAPDPVSGGAARVAVGASGRAAG